MLTKDQKLIAQIIARCWTNPAYRAAVFDNPTEEFRRAGVDMQPGDVIHVHEADFSNRHIVIPTQPLPGYSAEDAVALYCLNSRSIAPRLRRPGKAPSATKSGAKKGARKSAAKKSAARKGASRKTGRKRSR